jgi:uncharacterized protein
MPRFKSTVELPVSINEAFAYHEREGALQRLIPPWESVTIESSDHSIKPGSRVTLKTRVAGIPVRWVAEHRSYEPPTKFEDVALSGPFASWHHQHLFQSVASNRTELTDQVAYELPLGSVGKLAGGSFVRKQLDAMFAYRHRVTRDDLALVERYNLDPQTIGITGASGLLGRELMSLLSLLGHRPFAGKREGSNANTIYTLSRPDSWDGCDTVIHLAGKSIADQRWTPKVKEQLRSSRVQPTRKLCETLAALKHPPKTLLCASAIGIYGNRGDETLNESASLGNDFLAEIGAQWEQACAPARDAGIRVVNLRFGIILSPRGGALAKMLTPAKLGFAGPMGNGKQWMSWIALDDAMGAIYHAMATPTLVDEVNVVAPHPDTNHSFAKTLGKVLMRPAILPAPAFALRLALGEMADALLLTSTRVQPHELESTGYQFRFPDLEPALRHMLGR